MEAEIQSNVRMFRSAFGHQSNNICNHHRLKLLGNRCELLLRVRATKIRGLGASKALIPLVFIPFSITKHSLDILSICIFAHSLVPASTMSLTTQANTRMLIPFLATIHPAYPNHHIVALLFSLLAPRVPYLSILLLCSSFSRDGFRLVSWWGYVHHVISVELSGPF